MILATPFVVAGVTQGIKRFTDLRSHFNTNIAKTILRFVVALLSLVGATVLAVLNDSTVDPVSISTFVEAFMIFVGSTGVYFLSRK